MIRPLLFTLALSASFAASGQQLPRQVEFYFDADALSQRRVLDVKDTSPAGIDRLMRAVERNPEQAQDAAQLAHYAMQTGRADLGRTLYARALAAIDRNNGLWRPVKWTYGWDLYRAGDAAGALAQWSELGSRGIDSTWLPTQLAIALWTLDRRDEAVRWYAAAVRTEPGQWSTPARYAALLPQWRDDERATLAEVQAAWSKHPPAWP